MTTNEVFILAFIFGGIGLIIGMMIGYLSRDDDEGD